MLYRLLRSVAIVALSTRSLFAQSEPKALTADEVQRILKQRVDVDRQCVGIVVGVINAKGNEVIDYGSLRASGVATKPDADTVFEIGSTTKVFTTLLLADMVCRGELSLSDPASKFLPKTVTMPTRDGREITLLDLATHTSALPRIPDNLSPADGLNPYADYTVEQMYAALSNCKLTRAIGKKHEYSNLGMGLLGHILALRAGVSYEKLVIDRIAKPLGMKDTSITLSSEMKKRLAFGHNDTLEEVKNWDLPTLAGAGALRSTVGDMVKFVEANMGRPKSPLFEAMTLQLETDLPTDAPNLSIALGWHKLKSKTGEIIWHNGQTGGYHSFIGFDKKRGVGVVVLSNTAADVDDIGLHVLDRTIPPRKIEAKKERTAIKVDPKILDAYVGEYELVPTFVITITKEGDHLMLQATGQPKFEIFAESEKKFFLKVVDAQVTFVKDGKGNVSELILHQGGANQSAKKRSR
jgi:CubicO group peptidase (beta-lactamase class C family)